MKLLIIRFSSIGDIVLCTPVIRACKQQLNATVHLLTKSKFKNVISNNPHIDKIHHFEKDLSDVKNDLKRENFDYIIDLHRNLRSSIVKSWLKKPSGSFPKLNILKWFLVNFKVNRLPNEHIVDRYFKAFDKIENDGQGLEYYVQKENQVDLGIGQYITMVLGATFYTKRIPEKVLVEIISGFHGQMVLIGGPEEGELGEKLAKAYPHVYNACGKYNLDQSASIVQKSEVVVTSDTGMMHIAAAMKKRIIMVWGNTVPSFGMGPYKSEVHHFEVKDLPCRPCSKLGKANCPKGHFKCMMNQDVELLLAKI